MEWYLHFIWTNKDAFNPGLMGTIDHIQLVQGATQIQHEILQHLLDHFSPICNIKTQALHLLTPTVISQAFWTSGIIISTIIVKEICKWEHLLWFDPKTIYKSNSFCILHSFFNIHVFCGILVCDITIMSFLSGWTLSCSLHMEDTEKCYILDTKSRTLCTCLTIAK